MTKMKFEKKIMNSAKITLIFDLCYQSALCITYSLNSTSNRELAEILGIDELGNADNILKNYAPCIIF
jgi:hypothetical protein